MVNKDTLDKGCVQYIWGEIHKSMEMQDLMKNKVE